MRSEGLEVLGGYKDNATIILVRIIEGEYKGYKGVNAWVSFRSMEYLRIQ